MQPVARGVSVERRLGLGSGPVKVFEFTGFDLIEKRVGCFFVSRYDGGNNPPAPLAAV